MSCSVNKIIAYSHNDDGTDTKKKERIYFSFFTLTYSLNDLPVSFLFFFFGVDKSSRK